jgi:hypothetical protein
MTLRPNFEVLEDRLTPSFSWGGTAPIEGWSGPAVTTTYVVVGDFTGDDILDRLTTGYYTPVDLRAGLGDGTFAAPIRTEIPPGASLAAADFNGDGRLDAVTVTGGVGDFGGFGNVLLGRGDGTFYGHATFDLGLDNPTGIGIGDMDSNGSTDVAVAGFSWDGLGVVAVLYNDGDWPALPRSLRITDATVTEGSTGTAFATFTVTQPSGSTETVTVAYATLDGAAKAGSDFQAASGILTFAPGETSKTITVPIIGDRLGEPTETFTVSLSNPTNATIGDGYGVGTIVDDEPRISITDVTKAEGKKGQTTLFTFTVSLSVPYDQPVTVSFRTANGTARTSDKDYVAKSGTLTFAPGETTKTIAIEVKGDSKREGNEYFYLDLSGNSSNSWFSKSRGVGTILTDD